MPGYWIAPPPAFSRVWLACLAPHDHQIGLHLLLKRHMLYHLSYRPQSYEGKVEIRPSGAAIASRRAVARMGEYRRSIAGLMSHHIKHRGPGNALPGQAGAGAKRFSGSPGTSVAMANRLPPRRSSGGPPSAAEVT